jgi:hypothetical protein
MFAYTHPQLDRETFLREMALHCDCAVDRLVQGSYWDGSRGCAIGCSLETVRAKLGMREIDHGSHAALEAYLGIPRQLARLEDVIFEGLPAGEARDWPLQFGSSIRQGADLSRVWNELAPWILLVIVLPTVKSRHSNLRTLIERVAAAYAEGASAEQFATLRNNIRAVRFGSVVDALVDAAADAAAVGGGGGGVGGGVAAAVVDAAADAAGANAADAVVDAAADAAGANAAAAAADGGGYLRRAWTGARASAMRRIATRLCELLCAAPIGVASA